MRRDLLEPEALGLLDGEEDLLAEVLLRLVGWEVESVEAAGEGEGWGRGNRYYRKEESKGLLCLSLLSCEKMMLMLK